MKKRALTFMVVAALTGITLGGTAYSEGPPPHSHLLVTGIELDETGEWPVSIKKCRPLANGQAVPTNAHHAHLHTGRAGEALWAAGNAAVPVLPGPEGTPWTNCEELIEFFFGG